MFLQWRHYRAGGNMRFIRALMFITALVTLVVSASRVSLTAQDKPPFNPPYLPITHPIEFLSNGDVEEIEGAPEGEWQAVLGACKAELPCDTDCFTSGRNRFKEQFVFAYAPAFGRLGPDSFKRIFEREGA